MPDMASSAASVDLRVNGADHRRNVDVRYPRGGLPRRSGALRACNLRAGVISQSMANAHARSRGAALASVRGDAPAGSGTYSLLPSGPTEAVAKPLPTISDAGLPRWGADSRVAMGAPADQHDAQDRSWGLDAWPHCAFSRVLRGSASGRAHAGAVVI